MESQKCEKVNPEQYVLESAPTDAQLAVIRIALSEYAKKIPHHNISEFGEKITIQKSINYPVYFLDFDALVENRSVSTGEIPYNGAEIPQKIFHKPSDVNLWALEIDWKKEFKPQFAAFPIPVRVKYMIVRHVVIEVNCVAIHVMEMAK